MVDFKISSPAFVSNEHIPEKYTCDGDGISPPLNIDGVPSNSKSFALIVDDPDAPMGTFVHWVVWNIEPTVKKVEENSSPGTEGMNSARENSYMGPCPPSGTHRYFFKLYALDTRVNLPANSRKEDLVKAMNGHLIGSCEIIGLYSRK